MALPAERSHGSPRRAMADAIIVLGASVSTDAMPSRFMVSRVTHACHLYESGVGARLLLSGGRRGPSPTEADVMKRLAVDLGIPSNAVSLEDRSRTTWENAENCADIFRKEGWKTGILVTDRFHSPRAKLAFSAAGLTVRVNPCGTPVPPPLRLLMIIRELSAFVWYLLRAAAAGRTHHPRERNRDR